MSSKSLLASTASLPSELLRSSYLVDTGTQVTLVCSAENLTEMHPLDRPLIWASAAEGQSQQPTHRGTLSIDLVATDSSVHTVRIQGVYYAESARLNAVSPVDLYRAGVTLKLHSDEPENCVVTFLNEGQYKTGNVIWIEQLPFLPTAALVKTQKRSSRRTPLACTILGSLPTHDYVHLMFDHAREDVLRRLWERSTGLGSEPRTFGKKTQCHTCMETRGRIQNSNKSRLPEVVTKNDDLWCMDLLNLPAVPSIEGNIHCLIIIDAWSSYRTALFAKTKDGLIPQLSRYLLWHYNYTERHPIFFRWTVQGSSRAQK